MRYQDLTYTSMSAAQLADLEADIHDEEYSHSTAHLIDIDDWWRRNDHVYKAGTYYRGYRKRRLMQLVDVSSLRGKYVLDVGCGSGGLSVFMALHGALVSGFDLSRVGIDRAKTLAEVNGVAERCDFSVQNASRMPYDDQFFDVVVFNAVLHHALKYPDVRKETWRVLKPGGLCAFAEGIRRNSLYRAARRVKRAITRERVKGDVDITVHDLEEFMRGYIGVQIEPMHLTLGVKQLIGRRYNNDAGRRALFFALSQIDRLLLAAMPWLKVYCSEVVGAGRKPANATAGT